MTHNKAIAIYEQLVQNNPSVYEPALANSYYHVGGLYLKLRDYTCAEEYFKKARKVFVGLELENGEYIVLENGKYITKTINGDEKFQKIAEKAKSDLKG